MGSCSRVDLWISESTEGARRFFHNFLFALYKGNKCTNIHKQRREEKIDGNIGALEV